MSDRVECDYPACENIAAARLEKEDLTARVPGYGSVSTIGHSAFVKVDVCLKHAGWLRFSADTFGRVRWAWEAPTGG